MEGVCNQCGLPQDLCVCEVIAREQQKITIKVEKRKFGKNYTIVDGIKKEANVDEMVKKLKAKFACGGTVKDKIIELQGDHTQKAKDELINLGFAPGTISIIR